jgi:hypothetical protein
METYIFLGGDNRARVSRFSPQGSRKEAPDYQLFPIWYPHSATGPACGDFIPSRLSRYRRGPQSGRGAMDRGDVELWRNKKAGITTNTDRKRGDIVGSFIIEWSIVPVVGVPYLLCFQIVRYGCSPD